MPEATILQSFYINRQRVDLFVPANSLYAASTHSPYWAKVWPAAIGLCEFLSANLYLIKDKKVTELAAGLGLPALFAAKYATHVLCSDIEPGAMQCVQQSAQHNQLANLECTVASWADITIDTLPDVLLLSDVNYESEVFEELRRIIEFYLAKQCTVILSTPQRLMAKPFIEQLLVYCVQQEEVMAGDVAVSVFVLKQV